MINGAHAILYSDAAGATRAALARVLGTRSVDAGGGWLLFALPPAELAVHPAEVGGRAELYLMTDDLAATMATLQAARIGGAPPGRGGWPGGSLPHDRRPGRHHGRPPGRGDRGRPAGQ